MELDNKSKLFWIGLFVSVGIVLFVTAVLYLTDNELDTEYKFNVLFENGMGLESGSEVKMLGQEIGQVSDVKILDDRDGVLVQLSINDQLGIKIPYNSIFKIKGSIFGQAHIEIDPGDSSVYVQINDSITGAISAELYNFDPVLDDLGVFSRQLSTALTEKEVIALQSIIHNTDSLVNETKKSLMISQEVNKIIKNIENFSNELNSIGTNIGEDFSPKMIRIDSILIEIEDFSDDLEIATKGFNSFASSANSLDSSMKILQNLVDELNQGKGTLGKLLKDESLYENMNEVVDNAKELINDVKENPTKYVKAYWKARK